MAVITRVRITAGAFLFYSREFWTLLFCERENGISSILLFTFDKFDKIRFLWNMEFVVELNDKGIPIHNNLLLFPQGCTLTILRPLPRNDVVGVD